jgi:hypothetical protein
MVVSTARDPTPRGPNDRHEYVRRPFDRSPSSVDGPSSHVRSRLGSIVKRPRSVGDGAYSGQGRDTSSCRVRKGLVTTLSPSAAPAGTGIVWALVEDGFHVGSRGGEFLGYIDRQYDGRLLACDLYSRPVGHFDDLTAAMRALEAVEPATGRRG